MKSVSSEVVDRGIKITLDFPTFILSETKLFLFYGIFGSARSTYISCKLDNRFLTKNNA